MNPREYPVTCIVIILLFSSVGWVILVNLESTLTLVRGKLYENPNVLKSSTGIEHIFQADPLIYDATSRRNMSLNAHDGRRLTTIRKYVSHVVAREPGDEVFECVQGKLEGLRFPVCLFSSRTDQFISAQIKREKGRLWEETNIKIIQERLEEAGDDAGFIDIGANIGVFTLAFAHQERHVVSVEPMPGALRRITRAIELGNVEERVTLLQAAMSNVTGRMYLMIDNQNKGGSYLVTRNKCMKNKSKNHRCNQNHMIPTFTLDDLTMILPFKTAIVKMDCEGFEYLALKTADVFFENVSVPYILMEFLHYRRKHNKSGVMRIEIDRMITTMKLRGYAPCRCDGKILSDSWDSWPDNIAWIKQ